MEFGTQGQCIDVNSLFTSKLNNFAHSTALRTAQTGCLSSSQQHIPEQTNITESLSYCALGKAMGTVPLDSHKEPFTSNNEK